MADKEYYYFVYKEPDNDWSVNLQYSSENINFDYIKGMEAISISQAGMMYYRFEKDQITQKHFSKLA